MSSRVTTFFLIGKGCEGFVAIFGATTTAGIEADAAILDKDTTARVGMAGRGGIRYGMAGRGTTAGFAGIIAGIWRNVGVSSTFRGISAPSAGKVSGIFSVSFSGNSQFRASQVTPPTKTTGIIAATAGASGARATTNGAVFLMFMFSKAGLVVYFSRIIRGIVAEKLAENFPFRQIPRVLADGIWLRFKMDQSIFFRKVLGKLAV
jgi:hypothetical protein